MALPTQRALGAQQAQQEMEQYLATTYQAAPMSPFPQGSAMAYLKLSFLCVRVEAVIHRQTHDATLLVRHYLQFQGGAGAHVANASIHDRLIHDQASVLYPGSWLVLQNVTCITGQHHGGIPGNGSPGVWLVVGLENCVKVFPPPAKSQVGGELDDVPFEQTEAPVNMPQVPQRVAPLPVENLVPMTIQQPQQLAPSGSTLRQAPSQASQLQPPMGQPSSQARRGGQPGPLLDGEAGLDDNDLNLSPAVSQKVPPTFKPAVSGVSGGTLGNLMATQSQQRQAWPAPQQTPPQASAPVPQHNAAAVVTKLPNSFKFTYKSGGANLGGAPASTPLASTAIATGQTPLVVAVDEDFGGELDIDFDE